MKRFALLLGSLSASVSAGTITADTLSSPATSVGTAMCAGGNPSSSFSASASSIFGAAGIRSVSVSNANGGCTQASVNNGMSFEVSQGSSGGLLLFLDPEPGSDSRLFNGSHRVQWSGFDAVNAAGLSASVDISLLSNVVSLPMTLNGAVLETAFFTTDFSIGFTRIVDMTVKVNVDNPGIARVGQTLAGFRAGALSVESNAAVPEPSTLALLGAGAAVLGLARRRG